MVNRVVNGRVNGVANRGVNGVVNGRVNGGVNRVVNGGVNGGVMKRNGKFWRGQGRFMASNLHIYATAACLTCEIRRDFKHQIAGRLNKLPSHKQTTG